MIVFTNGCFDIIHPGHIELLERAKTLGTKLIVGINSDDSVRSIKGNGRPFQNQDARRDILMGLSSVDEVLIFDDLTPESLIKKLRPDVLVKGGDWAEDEIVGGEYVKSYGGKVFSLPLKKDFSSSRIVDKIKGDSQKMQNSSNSSISGSLSEHMDVVQLLASDMIDAIEACGKRIIETFKSGNKVMVCGNGGSAADAQHIAAEFVGRYETERRGLPAIAFTTDTSALTAVSNDFGFERVFARQVEALGADGDCLIAISTSGESPNVIAAVMAARNLGCTVVGLTGSKGKKLASLCDACVMVPSDRTARIQESHITIAHIWCEMVDRFVKESESSENSSK